ncbi:MAG: alpha/beta hydrolase, partial [Candidatus Omnitrophica bacterium]|nr:alpha/beta hydrolase [Candidatus Omnitrophota bacterium]
MPPIIRDEKRRITFRVWDVAVPKAIVVLVHGVCAHSEYWEFIAAALNRVGIVAYGIDLQGFGHTGGDRGHIGSFSTYYKSIIDLAEHARECHPG